MAGNADGKHVSSLLRWYRLNVQNWIWCAVRTLPSFIAFFSHSMNRFKKRSKSAAFSILASITVWACFSVLSAVFFYWKSFMGRWSDGLLFVDDFLFIAYNLVSLLYGFWVRVCLGVQVCVCVRAQMLNDQSGNAAKKRHYIKWKRFRNECWKNLARSWKVQVLCGI